MYKAGASDLGSIITDETFAYKKRGKADVKDTMARKKM